MTKRGGEHYIPTGETKPKQLDVYPSGWTVALVLQHNPEVHTNHIQHMYIYFFLIINIHTIYIYVYICISVYHVIGYYVNRTETTCTSLQNWFQTHRIFVTWGIARSMSLLPNDAKWCQVMPKLQKHPSMDHPVDSSKATGAACDCEAITGNPGATGNALVSKIWIQFINSNSQ